MVQKRVKHINSSKRWVEQFSTDRFVFWKGKNSVFYQIIPVLGLCLLFIISSCGEPEIKLSRADKRMVDTLVNNQLDSISPILDSLCKINQKILIENAVDSIIKERKKQEERLRGR